MEQQARIKPLAIGKQAGHGLRCLCMALAHRGCGCRGIEVPSTRVGKSRGQDLHERDMQQAAPSSPSFLRSMRTHIGTDLLWGLVAAIILVSIKAHGSLVLPCEQATP